MICFLGYSHAAQHLAKAASAKGLLLTDQPGYAEVIFVSEDTPTDKNGNRDTNPILDLIFRVRNLDKPIVITSQVPPGFTRSLGRLKVYHQAETLRIKDAMERALNPDYIAVGCATYMSYELLPEAYRQYLEAFDCEVKMVTWEDAEFSKIAVNMFLAAQVDATNRLADAASRAGASWRHVADILKMDKRIGPHCYLQPGRWQDSTHLLRDAVTLEEILAR